jgi:hypothetical protein
VKPGQVTALRIVTALLCAAGGILLLLCCGIGLKFWSLVGIILVVMALAGAYFIAGRDYIAGATPAALAGVVAVFVLLPPGGMELLAVMLLFCATGLAYALYEVD